MKCIIVRRPFARWIVQGIKKIEYRRKNFRAERFGRYGIIESKSNQIIGEVSVTDCIYDEEIDEYQWILEDPVEYVHSEIYQHIPGCINFLEVQYNSTRKKSKQKLSSSESKKQKALLSALENNEVLIYKCELSNGNHREFDNLNSFQNRKDIVSYEIQLNQTNVLSRKIYGNLGFPAIQNITGMRSIKTLYPGRQCGIYLIQFLDNTYYVGQAVDVAKRFDEHLRKDWDDVKGFSFFKCKKEKLKQTEDFCIQTLQQKCSLRNIKDVTFSMKNDKELIKLISARDQKIWLETYNLCAEKKRRSLNAELQRCYAKKFEKLIKTDDFNMYVIPVLSEYLYYCIPDPCKTERKFWVCSCVPCKNSSNTIYFRVNIGSQEVFTAGFDERHTKLFFSFHLTDSELSEDRRAFLRGMCPSLRFFSHYYKSGGSDQINAEISSPSEVLYLLHDKMFQYAIKTFNLAQMRKGGTLYHANHCYDLISLALKTKKYETE